MTRGPAFIDSPPGDGPGVGDPVTLRLRLMRKMCPTCIFRPAGERLPLGNRRVLEFVREAVRCESYVVCHSTLPQTAPAGVAPAICRGFADRYRTSALQLAGRVLGFQEVDLPGKDRGWGPGPYRTGR